MKYITKKIFQLPASHFSLLAMHHFPQKFAMFIA